MSSATIIAHAFGEGASLYEILGLTSDNTTNITAAQLRKAYYQKALLYHPDKNPNNPQANIKFQAISVAYDILKDPNKRAVYDESGELFDDDDDGGDNTQEPTQEGTDMWKRYFSQLFGRVTTNDIDKFAQSYKCSEEEQADVIKYYRQFRGNLTKMMDCVMLSTVQDAPRWMEDFLQPAIDRKEIPDYSKALQKSLRQLQKKEQQEENQRQAGSPQDDDAADSDETESEDEGGDATPNGSKKQKATTKAPPSKPKTNASRGGGTSRGAKKPAMSKRQREAAEADDLMAKIRNKNALAKRNDNLLSGLAARYGIKNSMNDDGDFDDPLPDDAEFARIQASLMDHKRKNTKTTSKKRKT